MSFTAIRDPHIGANIDDWAALPDKVLTDRVSRTLGLTTDQYDFDVRLYGHNAILEALAPDTGPAREVGVMLLVRVPDQATATGVAKTANPLMPHLPTPT